MGLWLGNRGSIQQDTSGFIRTWFFSGCCSLGVEIEVSHEFCDFRGQSYRNVLPCAWDSLHLLQLSPYSQSPKRFSLKPVPYKTEAHQIRIEPKRNLKRDSELQQTPLSCIGVFSIHNEAFTGKVL